MDQELKNEYIIADHGRACCFIIADGVKPSGKQRGYILRRLMRRMLSASLKMGIDIANRQYFVELVSTVATQYAGVYDEVAENQEIIIDLFEQEAKKYLRAIEVGQKEWTKVLLSQEINPQFLAEKTWDLYQSHGVPIEVSEDILAQQEQTLDQQRLQLRIEEHQKKSQEASAGQFTSGLGGDSHKMRRLHSVTHILHKTLRDMFGEGVKQRGSAITDQKARFDFSFDRALTDEEVSHLTTKVQEVIDKALPMTKAEMSEQEARNLGAIGLFGEKYGETVTVYSMVDTDGTVYTREFCGGPHIENTKEIGNFTVVKQKSVGQGIRRIEYNVE